MDLENDYLILGIPEDVGIKYSPKISYHTFSKIEYKSKSLEIDLDNYKKPEKNIIIENDAKPRRDKRSRRTSTLF